jgi:phosphoribosylglycinamide formyltransferase-1
MTLSPTNPPNPPKPEASPFKSPRLAVLISGGGTTMVNLQSCITAGTLRARIVQVISSRPDVKGIERANALRLPLAIVNRKDHADTASFSTAVFGLIRAANADYVCLAGFLSLLSIPNDYARKVLNTHPSLLPSFGGKGMFGRHVHEAVLAHGCKVSGCTVHFADQHYDTGPIIVQRTCPVLETDTPDTLAARVFEQECAAYPHAINLLAQSRVEVIDRRTRIL